MRILGEYAGLTQSIDGDTMISFVVEDDVTALEWLSRTSGKRLAIECKRYNEKRSISANNYFWKLCDEIAKVLATTQDEVHDLMLFRYGVRAEMQFEKEMLKVVESNFDIVQILDEDDGFVEARCFVGSRHYDTAEMARLIDGTVNDAKEMGISTWSQEEIERLVKEWRK